MDLAAADRILQELEAASGRDPALASLADDLLRAAVRYARFRTEWRLATAKERLEMEAPRTAAHDAFIDSCNILSRAMAGRGMDNRWRAAIGDGRKEVGDFACLLACLLGLRAR